MEDNNHAPKVVFEEENDLLQTTESLKSEATGMVGFLIKYSGGFIKDEKHANYVLLSVMAIVIIITIIVWN